MTRTIQGQAAAKTDPVEPELEGSPSAWALPRRLDALQTVLRDVRRDAAVEPKGYVTSWEVRGGGE